MIRMSRSDPNLGHVLCNRCSKSVTTITILLTFFVPKQIIHYWNKLVSEVKNSDSVLSFKIELGEIKKMCVFNSL